MLVLPVLFQIKDVLSAQCIAPATQSFSNAMGTAMATYLPRWSTQASAIRTIDKWFDVMNSPLMPNRSEVASA